MNMWFYEHAARRTQHAVEILKPKSSHRHVIPGDDPESSCYKAMFFTAEDAKVTEEGFKLG